MKRLGVFLLVLGATTLFNRASLSSVDEGFIFNTTAALVEKQSFQMDEQLSGRKYSRFSPLPSLFAAPFYAAVDKAIEGPFAVGAAKKRDWLLFAGGLSSCVLTAWTAVALVGLLLRLTYSEETSIWASLLWTFGTLAFPYSSSLFHQVAATLLMVYVCRFALAGNVVGTAITTALLVSIQLTLAVTVLPLFVREEGRWDRRALIGLGVGVVAGFGLHVLTNGLRGDHWLIGAYESETFTTPTFVGTVGLFFSSGKGLLWFAPLAFVGLVLLLPFAHRRPSVGRPLLFAVACHCIVVVHWWAWHGSLSWGPRLLLPILPLLFVPIADLIDRRPQALLWQVRGLGSIAAVSIFVNVWAATQPMIGFLNRIPNGPMSEWTFVPSLAPLSHPIGAHSNFFSFDSTPAQSKVVIACWVCLLLGGALATNLRGVRRDYLGLAPWAALAAFALAVSPNVAEAMRMRTALPQRRNLEHDASSATTIGELHFPIRGQFRLERSVDDDGAITVGPARLDRTNRFVVVEAAPMTVPIKFAGTNAELLWTLPGEGVFRSPVPHQYFSSRKSAAHSSMESIWRNYSWVFYLLAVPLYFDWLLGGRRMKETAGDGKEAKA